MSAPGKQWRYGDPVATAAIAGAAATSRPASVRAGSFSLLHSAGTSRPPSAASASASAAVTLSDTQRCALFSSDLTRLASSPSHDQRAAEMASFVLLRRCDHAAVRRCLFEHTPSTPLSERSPWDLLLALLAREQNVVVLAHALALTLTCGGTFRSDTLAREFVATKKDAASAYTSASLSYGCSLWRHTWSWSPSLAQQRCTESAASLVTPLLLSVHPTHRTMSTVLLQSSPRAAATLQHLWTSGCELILSLLQLPSPPPLHILQLRSFTLPQAFAGYVTSTLQQSPFLATSELALWRMMELAFELFFRDNSAAPSHTESASPLRLVIAACFKELCLAPTSSCCSEHRQTRGSSFDPFDASNPASSSPFLSLCAMLFRFIKQLLDDSTRASQATALWQHLPILHAVLLHALLFHESESTIGDHARGVSPLARDAEYILTRFYFDRKHVLKLLPLLTAITTSATGKLFQPRVALHLPPACEQLFREQSCEHFSYEREGLATFLVLHLPTSTPGVSLSLLPTSHSNHLLSVLLGLLKKYLLLAPDQASSTLSSTPSSASATAGGSTVRVVRDMQSEKIPRAISTALAQVLADHVRAQSLHDAHAIFIQRTLLEVYLWTHGRSFRFKELFDLAHRLKAHGPLDSAASDSSIQPITGSDLLYGLGTRVLLCLVDAITSSMQIQPSIGHAQNSGASLGLVDSSSAASLSALVAQHIAALVQDVASVLAEAHAAGIIADELENALQLRIEDVFDLTYRSAQTEPPPRTYPARAFLGILAQTHAFLLSVAPRFNPLFVPSSTASIPASLMAGVSSASRSFKPVAPLVPLPLASPTRRPFSSYAGSRSAAPSPRAPSYSPPSSAAASVSGLIAPLTPRAPITSDGGPLEPLSAGGGLRRNYKVSSAAAGPAIGPLPPRPAPPASSPRASPTPGSAPVLRPLVETLCGTRAPAAVMQVSAPISVKRQAATTPRPRHA